MTRFYDSPEALIVGFGGKVKRGVRTAIRMKKAAKKTVKKARVERPASRVKNAA
jgi:hypothetical protein